MLNLSVCIQSLLLSLFSVPSAGEAPMGIAGFGKPPLEKGVAMGLFASESDYDYGNLIDEIRPATGATHLSLVWVWWQKNLAADQIKAIPNWSATETQILAAMKHAKKSGFVVTAFPIVRLVHAEPSEWRGKIAPKNEDRWWDSYFEFIARAAELASAAGVERLSVGSELVSREPMRARWLSVIERLRLRHPKLRLMYSANWDHYEPVSFWDAVDHIGITGYWEIGKGNAHSEAALMQAWNPIKNALAVWSTSISRPIIITEIGYPSIEGALRWPWNETRSGRLSLAEQERGYRVFAKTFSDTPFIEGVYWWNWFGFGGAKDRNYTPRNKPASKVIADWYQSPSPN